MGYLLSTTIKGWIGSLETFISGFAGEGWRIWNHYTDAAGKKRWKASFDDLEVRGSFNVFELIVSKIRSIIGALGITQACGKIKEVRLFEEQYYIKVEDEMSFMQNDFIRHQRFSSDTLKQRSYWVKVLLIAADEIVIPYAEFTVGSVHTAPQVGDDIVQFGNETNTSRQSAIYIHADEDGAPAIDILYGINSKSFQGCVKVRLGSFIDNSVSHVGLMCVNGLLKSVNATGEEIYKINPDGSAFFAKGQVGVNSDGSGYIFKKTVDGVTKYGVHWDSVNGFVFGEDVKLSWNNLSEEAQTNLKGDQGVAGANGATLYTWIKYATSSAGAGISDSPTGMTYIGLAYNKTTATESTTATDYSWSLIKGTDGVAGAPGADGTTTYTWIKYSDVADGTGLYDIPTASTLYIGIAVNKTTATESTTKTDYVWSKFKGDQGVAGANGATLYTWIKYATSAAGAGLSDSPTGMTYIGLAYNKTTATESDDPLLYTWSLIKGIDGVPGAPGADGTTTYTWIKYSDVADGTGLYDIPTASTLYIGIAVNKTTATESTTKTDYVWSKFKGDQGVPGANGADGANGTDGTSPYFLSLDNDNSSLAASFDGTVQSASFLTNSAKTGLQLYFGNSAIADNLVTYSKASESGGSFTVSDANKTCKIDSFSDNQAYCIVNASIDSTIVATAIFTVTRVRGGSNGEDAVLWEIVPSVNVIKKNKLNVYSPLTVSFSIYKIVGTTRTLYVYDGVTYPPIKFRVFRDGVVVNAVDGTTNLAWDFSSSFSVGSPTTSMRVELHTSNADWLADGLLDSETIPVLIDGSDGATGSVLYTWIKYATSSTGANISNSPTGATYIGLAYNKTTATESDDPLLYTWSLIKGIDGVPGAPGADGVTTYTWIKYAEYSDGSGLYDTPTAYTTYIGIAVNKTTSVESPTKEDYVWSKFKGDQGVPGANGADGANGTDGSSAYQLVLSNQMASLVLNADGTLNYTDATTTPALYYGLNTVANVTYAIVAQTGVIASLTSGIVSVTSVTGEYTNVEITATLQGGSTPVARAIFKVVKVKGAISYEIIPSVTSVKKNSAGAYSASTVLFNVYRIVGGARTQVTNVSTDHVKMNIYRDGAAIKTIDGYLTNPSDFAQAFVNTSPGTVSITAKLYPWTSWDDANLLDLQTVPILIDGADANLLDWVDDWDNNKTLIGSKKLISPKIFSGTKDATTGALTGVALGSGVVTVNGVEKTGVFGLKDGVITFSIDDDGDVSGNGTFSAGDSNARIVLDPAKKSAVLYNSNGTIIGAFGFFQTNGVWDYSKGIMELYEYSGIDLVGKVRVSPSGIQITNGTTTIFDVRRAPSDMDNFSIVKLNIPNDPDKVEVGCLYRLPGEGVVRVRLNT